MIAKLWLRSISGFFEAESNQNEILTKIGPKTVKYNCSIFVKHKHSHFLEIYLFSNFRTPYSAAEKVKKRQANRPEGMLRTQLKKQNSLQNMLVNRPATRWKRLDLLERHQANPSWTEPNTPRKPLVSGFELIMFCYVKFGKYLANLKMWNFFMKEGRKI